MRPANNARPSRFVSSSLSKTARYLKKLKQRQLLTEMLEERRVMTTQPLTLAEMAQHLRPAIDQHHVSSVTVVTHGFQLGQQDGDAMLPLAKQLRSRIDHDNGPNADAWLLDYDVTREGGVGRFDADSSGRAGNSGFELTGTPRDIVLAFDWAAESNENSSGWAKPLAMHSLVRSSAWAWSTPRTIPAKGVCTLLVIALALL